MASPRIVIAGASSLLGAELKSLLEESRFAASDFGLVDEDLSVGTLTEAAGEAAVIQPVEEDSFNRANLIFFTSLTFSFLSTLFNECFAHVPIESISVDWSNW